jgi:hypothetical protein
MTQFLNGGGGGAVLIVADEKTAGTGGGTFTGGAWRTRTLNTVRRNDIAGASLASNQVTLPAGEYVVIGEAGADAVNNHQARLYDATNSAELVLGTSQQASSSNQVHNVSHLRGAFTLSATAAVELQHDCVSTGSFGATGDSGSVETFAVLEIRKVG